MKDGTDRSPQGKATSKFSVYENPVLSAALTARSLRPSTPTLLLFLFGLISSASALLSLAFREEMLVEYLKSIHVQQSAAGFLAKVARIVVLFVFLGFLSALIQTFALQNSKSVDSSSLHSSQSTKVHAELTKHQQELLGLRTKSAIKVDSDSVDRISVHQMPKSRQHPATSPSNILVPVHTASTNLAYQSMIGTGKHSDGKTVSQTPSGRSRPSTSLSPKLVSSALSQGSSHSTPTLDRPYMTPRLKQRSVISKEILNEEMLEKFLVDLDEKFVESATKSVTPSQSLMTPPPTLHGVGVAGHSPITSSTSGTTRSTPLRPVRASPSSQKYSTTPKKGEGDLPPPMTLEKSIEAFENLGVYPHIEQWRDRLRQWFSAVLLKPLLAKIEASHIQVMHTAAKVGISVSVNQLGNVLSNEGLSNTPPIDGTKEWQSTYMLDEDGILHQLRATLLQARDGFASQFSFIGSQHPQQGPLLPVIHECVDAITEHQKLHTLLRGELVKGLLPQSSVRADYVIQRIRELAEGTCLKNYEYLGSGEVYDKANKKWTLELPTDSHLLLYLFCAILEHPKWMLHIDPTSYASTQSCKNPLYLGCLPPKERLPEKYVAVLSSVPSVIHPGACILVVGKQSPPVFALYWDKKLQFSIQGRTALWDAILLFCHRIKVGYGSVVRGVHLGSSALNVLPILDLESQD